MKKLLSFVLSSLFIILFTPFSLAQNHSLQAGKTSAELGMHENALESFKDYQDSIGVKYGKESIQYFEAMYYVSASHFNLNNSENGLEHMRNAITIAEDASKLLTRLVNKNHPAIMIHNYYMYECYYAMGNLVAEAEFLNPEDKDEKYWENKARIVDQLFDGEFVVLPAEKNKEIIHVFNRLVAYFGSVNAITLSEQFHSGSYYLIEKTSGLESKEYAEALVLMSNVYISQGRGESMNSKNHEEAKSLLLEAMAIYLKNSLVKEDTLFFECLNHLKYYTSVAKDKNNGSVYKSTVNDVKINNLFLKSYSSILLHIKESTGESNIKYVSNLDYFARLLYWEDLLKSLPLWEEAYQLQEKRLKQKGVFDYDYSLVMDYLIDTYEGTFQREKAEVLYKRLLNVVEANVGKEDFFDKDNSYSNCILRLTNYYNNGHQYKEMIPWLEEYLKLNKNSPSLVYYKIQAQLIYAYNQSGNNIKAEALRKLVYSPAVKHSSDADKFVYLPEFYIKNDDVHGAIKEYQLIIQKLEKDSGSDAFILRRWLEKLIEQYEKAGQWEQVALSYQRLIYINEKNERKISYSQLQYLINFAYANYKLGNKLHESLLANAQALAINVDETHDWNGEEDYYRQIMFAFNKENYVKAEWLMKGYRAQPSKSEDVQSLVLLGSIYYYANDYDKAELAYEQALKVMRKTDFNSEVYDIVDFYTGTFQYDKALSVYKEYLNSIDDSEKNKPWFASCINQYGSICSQQGKWRTADSLYQHALFLLEPLADSDHYSGNQEIRAAIYRNIGLLNEELGRYDISELYLNKSLAIYNQHLSPSDNLVVITSRELAWIYELLGQHDASEKLFLKVLNRLNKNNSEQLLQYSLALHSLALVKYRAGDYQAAKKMEEEVLGLYTKIYPKDHPEIATVQNTLAHDYLFTGDYSKADKLYENAYAVQSSDSLSLCYVMNGMATMYSLTGRNDKAEEMFIKTLATRERLLGKSHALYLLSLFNLARFYQSTGRYAEAESLFMQCNQINLDQLEKNTNHLSEHEKALFREQNQKYIDGFINYAIERSGASPTITVPSNDQSKKILGNLFDLQLKSKGWVLSNSSVIKKRILGSDNQVLIAKYKHWEEYKSKVARASRLSKEERENAGINLEVWNTELNQLEKELSASAQQYNVVFNPVFVDWKSIQKSLKPGEAAVEVIRTLYTKGNSFNGKSDTVYVALILTSTTTESPEIVVLNDGKKMEDKWLKTYRNSAIFKIEDNNSYNAYWAPINKLLNGVTKVYYSPDGAYHQINLNTLKNPASGKFIIDELEIFQMTNLSEMLSQETKSKSINSSRATMVGNPTFNLKSKEVKSGNTNSNRGSEDFRGVTIEPLPGTLEEVMGIKKILGKKKWDINLYTGEQALEENIKNVNSPSILHIATHGFFVNKANECSEPMLRSGLILSGAVSNLDNLSSDKEDGILTAYEATSLNLEKTDLVILSACETGLGEVAKGEGVYGLQRGFKVAGAKSIVISLWKVNDVVTQELMLLFYNNWLKTGNSRTAFINAQRSIKAKYKDAYYWGAFIMVGE